MFGRNMEKPLKGPTMGTHTILLMAYFHCRRWIWIQIRIWIPVLCLYYSSTGLDSDSDLLIQMYGIGMEICLWDGDLSLKWVQ